MADNQKVLLILFHFYYNIHKDDIEKAFTRHATSKISIQEDLWNINTLGFRGEALASIISIAKVTCITKTKDDKNGNKAICENSEVKIIETGCDFGTTMEIKDLFYNVPARAKFLKTNKTEEVLKRQIVEGLKGVEDPNYDELLKTGFTKMLVPGDPKVLLTLQDELRAEFGEKAVIFTSKPYFLEILPPNCGKGEAVLWLANHLGIDKSKTGRN